MTRIFGCPYRLGVSLTSSGLAASVIRKGFRRPRVLQEITCLNDGPVDGDAVALAALFKELALKLQARFRRADLPVYVSVPEHLVVSEVFAFDAFPSENSEADVLVAHRMARELGCSADQIFCDHLRISDDDKTIEVAVRALDADLVRAIDSAASGAGLRISRLDGFGGFAENAVDIEDAGLFWSDGSAWLASGPGWMDSGQVSGAAGPIGNHVVRLHRSAAISQDHAPSRILIEAPTHVAAGVQTAAGQFGIDTALTQLEPLMESASARVALWA